MAAKLILPPAGVAQLRRNFSKILRRFPIQLSSWNRPGCLLPASTRIRTQNRGTPFADRRAAGHKSKGFLKKLPINRRVSSVQWAFSPPWTLKFLNSPEKKPWKRECGRGEREQPPLRVCHCLPKSISSDKYIDATRSRSLANFLQFSKETSGLSFDSREN